MKKFIGFIPAREGSIRIPNKNLILIKKKSLFLYSVEAAKNTRFLSQVVVFSDSKKINLIAKKLGVGSLYKRPKYLSKKNTSMFETLNYFIKKNDILKKFEYLVLLQPTSPLRTSRDIDKACQILINNKKADGLVSTFKVKKIKKKYPDKYMTLKKNYLIKVKKSDIYQIKKNLYIRNGPAILILKIKKIKKNLYNNKLLNYVMPEKKSIDINTINELREIRKFF